MPRGKVKQQELHTKLKAEQQRNQALILSMLAGLASNVSEMKHLIAPEIKIPPHDFQELIMKGITFGSLPFCLPDPSPPTDSPAVDNERVDAMNNSLEAEVHNQSQILSTLTGLVSDMSKMKRLITAPLTPKDELFIQEEIMKRLPVKSLVRFRSVSRSWKSLIDSSKFIRTHKNQPKHLFVQYKETELGKIKYISFADNDSFPNRRFVPSFPPSISGPKIVGISYGLLCLYCYDSEMFFFWNPSIKKSIAIDVPEEFTARGEDDKVLGFGVCPVTIDPKIVHITHLCPPQARDKSESETKKFGKFWKVKVYKLSSGKFIDLSSRSSNLPAVSIRIERSWTQVVIDRHIHWCAEVDLKDGTSRNLVMSFDITDEKFKAVDLPSRLASLNSYYLSVSKHRESLVILKCSEMRDSYGVWKMMDHGLFTKLFTIKPPLGSIMRRVVGFRNTGEPFMCVLFHNSTQLVAYKPNSKTHTNLVLPSHEDTYSVESYMETLLLIGRSDCISTSF